MIHALDLVVTGIAYLIAMLIVCGGIFLLWHSTGEALSEFREDDSPDYSPVEGSGGALFEGYSYDGRSFHTGRPPAGDE